MNYEARKVDYGAIMKELTRRDQERHALMHWKEEREQYWQTYWEALRELRAAHAWRSDLGVDATGGYV